MGNPFGRNQIVALTNQSGAGVVLGDFVYVDTGHAKSFITGTTANYTKGIGIAQQTIANGAIGLVLIGGYTSLVNVNASVTLGNFLASFTVAKQGTDGGASRAAGTCGMFLTGGATPDAVIWQPDLGGGSGMTNPMTTTGDMIYSSSGSTPARLAAVAAGQAIMSAGTSTAPAYAFPPGHEFDYAQITTTVDPTATTAATGNTVITGNAVTYDGSTVVMIEFFTERLVAGGTFIILDLWEDSTDIGRIALGGNTTGDPCFAVMRRTPSNASHTYKVTAYIQSGTGHVYAGAGGVDTDVPAFLRVVKA